MTSTARSSSRLPLVVIGAGCLVLIVCMGVRTSFGLFLQPVSTDLGWGREVFALGIALQNLIWGAAQPFAGAIADKFGTGRTIAGGVLLCAIGTILMSQTSAPLEFHVSAGLLVGLGLSGSGIAVVLSAMTRTVPEEKRSMVFGIGTAAASLGQFLMVPLGQAFLDAYGWSTALLLLGLLTLAVAPLAAALTGRPQSTAGMPEQSLKLALAEAGRHRGYWLLIAGFFVCGFHVAFIAAHMPAYIVDRGLLPGLAATALALVGLFNIVGSYSAGVLGGKLSKKYCLSFLYAARSVVILIFISMPMTQTSVLVFAAAMGLLWLSTVPLTSGLVAQIFGPRYMATLFGIVFFSHQVGSFLGVWLGGRLFDTTGSYDVVWWLGIALGVIAALLHWPIDERSVRLARA